MKTTEALQIFGGDRGSRRKLANALDISVAAISQWGDEVPPLRAYQIRDLIAAGKVQPVAVSAACACEHKEVA